MLLFVIGMAAFSFLGGGESGIACDDDGVFEKARKRLIDWMKIQAVIMFLFVGIAGFFIIQQSVQSTVNKEVERTLEPYLKQIDGITTSARSAGIDAGVALREASSATSKVEQAAAAATELVDSRIALFEGKFMAEETQLTLRIEAMSSQIEETGRKFDFLASNIEEQAEETETRFARVESIVDAAAIRALGKKGPAAHGKIDLIIEALESDDERLRLAAAEAIGYIGRRPDQCVPALKGVLERQDESPQVLAAAAGAMAAFGADARKAGAILVDLIGHEEEFVAVAAATTAIRAKCQLDDAIAKICEQIEKGRFADEYMLGRLEVLHHRSIDISLMRRILRNGELTHRIRSNAARVLCRRHDTGSLREVLAILKGTMGTPDDRAFYASALDNWGTNFRDSIMRDDVVAALKDGLAIGKTKFSANPYAVALGAIGAEEAIGTLRIALEEGDVGTKFGARMGLAEVQGGGDGLVGILTDSLEDQPRSVSMENLRMGDVFRRLMSIAHDSRELKDLLIEFVEIDFVSPTLYIERLTIRSTTLYVERLAIQLLGTVGGGSDRAVIRTLERIRTESGYYELRVQATLALMNIRDAEEAPQRLKPAEEGG
ncbi:MAG: HEAT repeat domain-containing protein [Planctomycetes bacterium]|nr:HEAT repeat domain-containing protein [Planctomycetota bacterium]